MKFALQDTRADGMVIYIITQDFYNGNIINKIVNANQWIEKVYPYAAYFSRKK